MGQRLEGSNAPAVRNMKKTMMAIFAVCAMVFASCQTTTPVAVTANPVGNKCGEAKTTLYLGLFGGSADVGINTAAKKGGITRISHVDMYQKNYVFVKTIGVRVYGE